MADVMTSALPAASVAAAANEYPINEAGTSKKVTGAQIKTFATTAPVFAAGTASAGTHPKLTSGTLLTTPEAGAMEFDGTAFYQTIDTTSGRAQECDEHIFRLVADGSAIGPTIADYFGSNSALPTVTNGVYQLTYYLWFLKTTANTVTFTITNTQTYTAISARFFLSPLGGSPTSGSGQSAGIQGVTTAAAALPATGSVSSAVLHHVRIEAIAECATAGNIRLRITSASGTVTPRRGSYYTARRLFAGNVGIFVA